MVNDVSDYTVMIRWITNQTAMRVTNEIKMIETCEIEMITNKTESLQGSLTRWRLSGGLQMRLR